MKWFFLQGAPVNIELPTAIWIFFQVISVSVVIACIIGLFIQPDTTLYLLWSVLIPIMPFLLFIAPGFWRNTCPIASLSQLPRITGFGGKKRLPQWLVTHSGLISLSLFILIVSSRKIFFNEDATALASLIIGFFIMAIFMGLIYQGKSGWCTNFCPMFPVERLYGQTAFVEMTHNHCQPCVGCTKYCHDLKPRTSYLSTLHSRDKMPAAYLIMFASIFPGFILAYYIAPDPSAFNFQEIGRMYGYFLIFCVSSVSVFFSIKFIFQLNSAKMIILYSAAALNIYYWFNAPLISVHFTPAIQDEVNIAIRVLVAALSSIWIVRAYCKTNQYRINTDRLVNMP